MSLESRIKNWSHELGFLACGISAADNLDEQEALLADWLDSGYHGTMDWMRRRQSERTRPTSFFPQAKSIITVAENYFRSVDVSRVGEREARISLYAQGRDYHKVLRRKLKLLLEKIRSADPTVEGRVCVDSFPLMEKPVAVRAGIGWIGKHTNLIRKQDGSFFFLGELLLSIELESDQPFTEDHCGTCSRCQDACPTDALSKAYVLDSNRCISYLTIEHDGQIDADLLPGMENWVFGCDICQEVCPWNRFSTDSQDPQYSNRLQSAESTFKHLFALTESDFAKLFAGTPVKRAGYENFMRNLAIAEKNSGE